MKLASFPQLVRTELILFFALWLVYGLAINSTNLEEFNLQQAGVEAIVDRHQLSVEGLSSWPVTGDVFGYNGHTYSNKHPGQAMTGAVAYSFLRLIGLSYAKNRLLAAALVTFLTASLLTAVAGVVIYRLAWEVDDRQSKLWAIATALAFGLGTTAFVYSGIAHHDTIATAYLIVAFYVIFRLWRDRSYGRMKVAKAVLAGLLLGLTITTSMLHFFMVIVVGIYFLSMRQWRLTPPFVVGGCVGVLPLLIYNAVNFGNPFLLPAIANYRYTGYDPEVFFHFEWNNFVHKINVYSEFVTLYAPILWIGLLGLCFVPRQYRREKYFVAAAVLVLFLYVTNVQGLGTCAYGPRYLLPVMPFASLGLIGIRRIPSKTWKSIAGVVLFVVGIFSGLVNVVGAVQGAMYCNLARYAFPDYLLAIMRGELPERWVAGSHNRSFPLLPWLLPFVLLLIFVILWQANLKSRRTDRLLPGSSESKS